MDTLRTPLVSTRGEAFDIFVDGQPMTAFPGETIAGVLLEAGRRSWRRTPGGKPRGLFCGIGTCFDCTLTVNDTPYVRACQTLAQPGMVVITTK
ncbi:MAG: (2Fe-2S)-binding protein [Caldilineaceae bacterium]|nr:(2Fe-2S)-binding protein [Caldilineaceae bacterium]MBP8107436.1 (2Fe-2S)-binding protein [Caldilineaceae bacterium]MBP8123371.1 (2Fe-2S)-binding protein [Caldilineaceae bacterium]MBP9070979.1 (2Fe-2S)-binding protein [Caldilineaceae bacterium]